MWNSIKASSRRLPRFNGRIAFLAILLCFVAKVTVAAADDWFAFNPPADTFAESPIDLRFLNEKFAGEHGLIAARGDEFIHSVNQEPVRFWAVNMTLVAETLDRRRDARARRERSDELWSRAQLLAAEGKYAEAVRDLYLSALYALEEHALLRVQAGLTNREHASRVAQEHPELSEAFGSLVQRYDRLRYGAYAADAGSFSELSGLVERTRRLA
jgi:hypothetical protein